MFDHLFDLLYSLQLFLFSQGEESSCPVSVVILLLVKYAPELTLTQVDITSTIDKIIISAIMIRKNTILFIIIMLQEPPQTSKGGSIKISCKADANPPQVKQST